MPSPWEVTKLSSLWKTDPPRGFTITSTTPACRRPGKTDPPWVFLGAGENSEKMRSS
ncbi:unnamed protein product [Spirodela intermedia]|uniref:Uncharacterized protein n=1 Tax=Spirodela intermedia TaxID=51605 RepID=A0A7I8KXY0_SPIIN|nr:unnamed protein product [Spirodela intermedia]